MCNKYAVIMTSLLKLIKAKGQDKNYCGFPCIYIYKNIPRLSVEIKARTPLYCKRSKKQFSEIRKRHCVILLPQYNNRNLHANSFYRIFVMNRGIGT